MKSKKIAELVTGDKFYDNSGVVYEVVSILPVNIGNDDEDNSGLVRVEAKRIWNCPDTCIVAVL